MEKALSNYLEISQNVVFRTLSLLVKWKISECASYGGSNIVFSNMPSHAEKLFRHIET